MQEELCILDDLEAEQSRSHYSTVTLSRTRPTAAAIRCTSSGLERSRDDPTRCTERAIKSKSLTKISNESPWCRRVAHNDAVLKSDAEQEEYQARTAVLDGDISLDSYGETGSFCPSKTRRKHSRRLFIEFGRTSGEITSTFSIA